MSEWKVELSQLALNSSNPIVSYLKTLRETSRTSSAENIIDLSTSRLCKPPDEVIDSLIQTINEGRHNGYAPSVGFENTRNAILNYLNQPDLTPKDILLSSGASSCLDIAITALAERGQNILIPKPHYPHYRFLAHGLGIDTKEYELTPQTWEVNLLDLKQKIDKNTAAILINNPHNPTGALYSETHLENILELAARHRLPVICDETYRDLIFPGNDFVSAIVVNKSVPLLIIGALGKSFMVPGWRIGWILVHDPVNAFDDVRKALISLSQRIIGCNTVMQGAINTMIGANCNFRQEFMQKVEDNARYVYEELHNLKGIEINLGKGIYTLIKLDLNCFKHLQSCEEFCRRLYENSGVITLPGMLFGTQGFFRICLDLDKQTMRDAVARIKDFVRMHNAENNCL